MVHIRKEKGDIGAAVVLADLTIKGYSVFTPAVAEHLPFDIIAYKDNVFHRIQAKYSSTGDISKGNAWNDKHGTHKRNYSPNDFDYYRIYLPDIKRVVYPSINFAGMRIASTIPNSATPFWWWEDFQSLTDKAEKRHYSEFGIELTQDTSPRKITRPPTEKTIAHSMSRRKVDRPSKEALGKLLWELPTSQLAKQFGVSDKAISKWAKTYGISKPPRGHWTKQSITSS